MESENKIEIKSINGEVLFSYECVDNTIKKTLEHAVKNGANLRGAYLRGAYLRGAYLREANLCRADLGGANLDNATYGEGVLIGNNPIQILGLKWNIIIFQDHVKISCELHSKEEWKNFTDEEILDMDKDSLDDWKKYKNLILGF